GSPRTTCVGTAARSAPLFACSSRSCASRSWLAVALRTRTPIQTARAARSPSTSSRPSQLLPSGPLRSGPVCSSSSWSISAVLVTLSSAITACLPRVHRDGHRFDAHSAPPVSAAWRFGQPAPPLGSTLFARGGAARIPDRPVTYGGRTAAGGPAQDDLLQ